MVVAIDGPAGAGKSSVARAVARECRFTYLDTGAMYRCVALAVQRNGRPAAEVARQIKIDMGDDCVLLDGEDVSWEIRTKAISEQASRVSTDPGVREALVARQQELLGDGGDWVAEGRDIGTVVCPQAEVKVFLTAAPQERAKRRAGERGEDLKAVLAEQEERDQRDMKRELSPLHPAPDAVPIDTTGLSLEEVVEQVKTLIVEAREIGC
jgi:cytidylate kinase